MYGNNLSGCIFLHLWMDINQTWNTYIGVPHMLKYLFLYIQIIINRIIFFLFIIIWIYKIIWLLWDNESSHYFTHSPHPPKTHPNTHPNKTHQPTHPPHSLTHSLKHAHPQTFFKIGHFQCK